MNQPTNISNHRGQPIYRCIRHIRKSSCMFDFLFIQFYSCKDNNSACIEHWHRSSRVGFMLSYEETN